MTKGPHTARISKIHPIEDELARLQNVHRLAIHVWENHKTYQFPNYSWEILNTCPAADIPHGIRDRTAPIISMSLLPSRNCGFSMRPYDIHEGAVQHCAYLIDMSDDQPNAPRVLRVSHHGLMSGVDVNSKNLQLGTITPSPRNDAEAAMRSLYRGKSTNIVYATAASEEGKAFTAKQLDTLGKLYDTSGTIRRSHASGNGDTSHWLSKHGEASKFDEVGLFYVDKNKQVANFNELLAAASTSHIKAIAVPIMNDPEIPHDWYLPLQKLVGAIAGLQHLKHKPPIEPSDLPVVLYHVNDQHIGTCSYLAQGEAELIEVAKKACQDLEKQKVFGQANNPETQALRVKIQFDTLKDEVRSLLSGLDIEQPIAAQHKANTELDQRIKEATIRERQ